MFPQEGWWPSLRDRKAEKLGGLTHVSRSLETWGSIPQFLEAHLYSDGKEERI